MSNDTNVDDPPEDAPDTVPDEEQPARQGERSPLEDEGDRRTDVDDPIDEGTAVRFDHLSKEMRVIPLKALRTSITAIFVCIPG